MLLAPWCQMVNGVLPLLVNVQKRQEFVMLFRMNDI